MKGFVTALLSASAYGWGKEENTFMESRSEVTNTVLIKTEDFIWSIDTQTVMNEDTGLQYLRVIHELQADIFADDEIIFEVAFQT